MPETDTRVETSGASALPFRGKLRATLTTHVTLLIIVSGVASALGYLWGRHQYLGMDDSAAISAAWQMVHGRAPYRDFLTGMPPFYLAILKMAFAASPNFQSLLVFEMLFSFLSSLIIGLVSLTMFRSQPHIAYLGAAVVLAINGPTGIPWYNCTTTTITVVTFCLTSVIWHRPNSRWLILLPFFWMASLYSKATTGIPAALLSIAVITIALSRTRRIIQLFAAVGGFVVLVGGVTAWLQFTPGELVANYHDWSVRVGSNFIDWSSNGTSYTFGILIAIGALFLAREELRSFFMRKHRIETRKDGEVTPHYEFSMFSLLFGVCFALVVCIGLYENNELKTGVISAAAFMLWWSLPPAKRQSTQFGLTQKSLFVLGIAIILIFWWPLSDDAANANLAIPVIASLCLVVAIVVNLFVRRSFNSSKVMTSWGFLLVGIGSVAVFMLSMQYSVDRTPISIQPFFSSQTLSGFPSSDTLYPVLAGPDLHNTNNYLQHLQQNSCTQQFVDPTDVFIGPRIDYAYAQEGWLPPKGLPIWWEAYTYGSSQIMHYDPVATFEQARPTLAVFWDYDATFIPVSVLNWLNANYSRVNLGNLIIYGSQSLVNCYLGKTS